MRKYFAILMSLSALTGAYPLAAKAQDARMSYKTASGAYAAVAPVSAVCSVDSSGVPQLCADGIAGDSASGTGILTYTTPSGAKATVQPVVPVCSLSSTGVPEICDFSSTSSDVTSGLVVGTEQAVTANGTWPTTDPLIAGQAWQSNGVMMLSTGAAAAPTFDGSYLNVTAGGVTGPLGTRLSALINSISNSNSTANKANSNAIAAQTAAEAAQTTADAAIPLTQKGAASGVASLDANGNMTAPILSNSAGQTGALQVNGQINAQGIGYFVSSMAQIQGIISGSSKKWTLTRRDQDTYTKLNNYTGSSWTAFTFNDDGTLDSNLGTFANLSAAAPFTVSVSAPVITATTTATAPTPAAGDNSTNVATTAFVNTAVQGASGYVTGDISASGSSLSMPIGSSGLTLTMSYVTSGTGSLSIVSTNGTLTPVDIYETAAWGTTSFKGYVLDSGTITTTATTVDSTFYLSSNAWGTYHIRAGGVLYVVDIFGSGKGARTTMSWRKIG